MEMELVKKRGRPPMVDLEQRKLMLMNSAIDLFLLKGHHGTRIEDIAKMAKVSKTSFYNYFTDKDHLIKEVIEVFFKKLRRPFYETIVELSGPIQFKKLIEVKSLSVAEILMENKKTSLFIIQQGRTLNPELLELIQQFNLNIQQVIQKLLKRAINKSLIPSFNTHIASLCMFASMEKLYEEWLQGNMPYPHQMVVNEIVDLFFS